MERNKIIDSFALWLFGVIGGLGLATFLVGVI